MRADGAVRAGAVTPERAGWGLQRPARPGAAAGGSGHRSHTGDDEMIVLPLAGGCDVACDDERFDADRARDASSPGSPTSPTCRATPRSTVSSERGGRFALPAARADRAAAGPLRPGRGRAGRAARRRAGQPPGQQLLHARTLRGRPADRRRGAHPGRQLVVLPAAQARRGARGRVRAGGDLLLRGRPVPTARPASPTSACTAPDRAGRSTSAPRSAAATPCSSRTAGTARRWPRPATTSTTSTSWPGRRERAWLFCDDPAHAWVRGTWDGQEIDPRLPLHPTTEERA